MYSLKLTNGSGADQYPQSTFITEIRQKHVYPMQTPLFIQVGLEIV